MPTPPKVELLSQPKTRDAEPLPDRRREEVIRSSVLTALGHPARLLKVAVLPLWGDNFRVNVWTAEAGAGNGIPNSYFVTADGAGGILRSEPPIQKLY